MKEDRDSAARYRHHAEELRAIAESYKNNVTREALLRVAEDYEQMALSRERIDGRFEQPSSA
jgi:hypothetical protein